LKTKKQNIGLRELFRNKLENAEVIPDAAVKSILMRRMARKEFLRFHPSRFNIYYVGGILITGITAAVLLYSGTLAKTNLNTANIPDKIIIADTNKFIEVPLQEPIKVQINKSNIIHNESVGTGKVSDVPSRSESDTPNLRESHKNILPDPTSISSTFSKNEVFTDVKPDTKKLRRGFKSYADLIDPKTASGCAPLKVHFYNQSVSYDSCRWTFGDGGYSGKKDPDWIFDVEGEYKVVLEVFDRDGKHFMSTASVTVHPRPQAHFEIAPDKAVLPNDEIRFMNYSTNAVRFKWDFGDGSTSDFFEPEHTYTKFGNYNVRLFVYSDWGCSDSLTVFNAFSGSEYFIDFPNAFIPNTQGPSGGFYSSKSDEAAQVFHPSYSAVSDYQLKIFSKLGILIFESNDISLGWDGYNKGQLCEPGVYIWKVRGKFRNGEPFIKMGDVTLLKN
jgi:PKD repeat protein